MNWIDGVMLGVLVWSAIAGAWRGLVFELVSLVSWGLALLAALHAQLRLGRGSIPRVQEMQRQLDEQIAANDRARQANERLNSEVHDLKEGLDMVEEKARSELGMVKPNEVYVHYMPR